MHKGNVFYNLQQINTDVILCSVTAISKYYRLNIMLMCVFATGNMQNPDFLSITHALARQPTVTHSTVNYPPTTVWLCPLMALSLNSILRNSSLCQGCCWFPVLPSDGLGTNNSPGISTHQHLTLDARKEHALMMPSDGERQLPCYKQLHLNMDTYQCTTPVTDKSSEPATP